MEDDKQVLTTGQAYGITILTQYEKALAETKEYRLLVINNQMDKRAPRNLAVVWTNLWFALKPEVESRPDLLDVEKKREYMAFEKYWKRPIDLTEKDHIDDLFKLAEVISRVLYKLDIIKLEKIA
jgi:hypothetical protein